MKYYIYIVYAITAFVIGVVSVQRLIVKPDLPFGYGTSGNESLILNDYEKFKSGDRIVSVNSVDAGSDFQIEIIVDSKMPGDVIPVTAVNSKSEQVTLSVTLTRYYRNINFIAVTSVTGFAFLLLGIFVIRSKPGDKTAARLFLTLITFSVAVLASSGQYSRGSDWTGYAVRISHLISYIAGSVFFLSFIFNFPFENNIRRNLLKYSVYILVTLFTLFASYFYFITLRELNPVLLSSYEIIWKVCESGLLASLLAGIIMLFIRYRKIKDNTGRRKIEWVFWGMALGAGPFILFWLVPRIFGLPYILSEEFILAFLIFIPVSFAMAVVRYHIFDIEIIIKRSIIYFILTGLLLFLYYELIINFSNLFTEITGYESKDFYILTAILLSLLLNPLKERIKKIVDKVFYREKYVFGKAIQKISLLSKECNTAEELGSMLVKEINELIPVKSAAVLSRTVSGEKLKVLAQNNFEKLKENIGAFRMNKFQHKTDLPFSSGHYAEPDVKISDKLEPVLKRWQIAIVIPLVFNPDDTAGAIVLGEKLSGMRFSVSDVEILNTIASSSALVLKRMELQEKLLTEEMELEKTREISELKSYFVASVSHDLKTPLSAIKIFTELLQNENITKEKSQKYFAVLEGETERLRRMIENILNYSKIEKGLKQYSFRKTDLNKTANEVTDRMNYELGMKNFTVDNCIESGSLFINADPEAVTSVLENLISNSIKYSGNKKYIKISTHRKNGEAELTVEDSGTGISENNLRHIFDPYYRETSVESSGIKGAGLGLSIVRNIVNEHKGSINVKSTEGEGSKFTITFPVYQNGN